VRRGLASHPTGSVARLCLAVGSIGVREGANRSAWAHSAGQLCQLIGRPRRTAPVARFKPDLKSNPNSNGSKHFQTISKFDRLEKYFHLLRKIEIKYGFEDLKEGNNFLYRIFLRFGMYLELKFKEFCMSRKQGKIHWINLGLWNLMKLGQQLPLYSLLKGKISSKKYGSRI
jgi:hypothetical protein